MEEIGDKEPVHNKERLKIPLLEKEDITEIKIKIDEDKKTGNIFVIHEHDATRLHWDLRLEIDGVLKSWAVPKEPPITEGVKRLAIQVDDHPLEYADFEGVIPEGSYGAGTVKIYDKGEFILGEKTDKKIEFELRGKKLNGKYALVKFKGDKQFLFFKMKS